MRLQRSGSFEHQTATAARPQEHKPSCAARADRLRHCKFHFYTQSRRRKLQRGIKQIVKTRSTIATSGQIFDPVHGWAGADEKHSRSGQPCADRAYANSFFRGGSTGPRLPGGRLTCRRWIESGTIRGPTGFASASPSARLKGIAIAGSTAFRAADVRNEAIGKAEQCLLGGGSERWIRFKKSKIREKRGLEVQEQRGS